MPDSTITLRTRTDLAGVSQAVAAYESLDKTQQALARSATAAAQNAARLDAALKGPTAGADALKAHLQNAMALDPRQAVSAINQVIAAENKAANSLGPALPRTLEQFGTEAIDQFKQGLISIVGPAAAVTAAMKAIPAAIDLAELGARADLVRARFDSLAKSAGITGDALLIALRKGSGGEINDLNLQLAANKAQLLGVAHSADQFGILMSIARDRAQQMGITTTQAFDDLTTGLGRGSKLILDNLGILVNADEANKAYAQSIGKTVGALTDQERKQALINQVLKDGQATIAATGGAVDSAASAQARLGASIDNVKTKFGSLIANGTAPAVNGLSDLLNGFDGTSESMAAAAIGAQNLVRAISGLPPVNKAAQQTQQDWTHAIVDWIAAREVQLGLASAQTPSSGGGGSFEFPDVQLAQQSTQAQLAYASALEMTGIQARAAALAADQKSTSDKVASIDAQTHAIAQAKLADQAQAAAKALLQTGPAGASTAALLASSSSQVDVLTAAYYRLFTAQGQTKTQTDAQKGLSALRSGSVITANEISDANTRVLTKASESRAKADDKAKADAARLNDLTNQNRLINATTSAAKIRELERQKSLTTDVIKRQEIQNQIDQERQTKSRAGASAGGKGLGALDRVDISLAGDYQAQLDAVNAKLATGHLTELQTKQLKKEQLDLQKKIADEQERANNAALDARIAAIENRKKDREDARRLAAAQAVLANPNAFSAEQRTNAADLVELLPLEQQKRNNDVAAKAREAGIAIPTGAALPTATAPGAALPTTQAPVQQLATNGANGTPLILQLDGKDVGSILLPFIIQGLSSRTQPVRAAGG